VVQKMVYTGSSFTGKNFDNETVLGKFIKAVKNGEISNPVCLCFENWDRFGRDVEWKNTKRFASAASLLLAMLAVALVSTMVKSKAVAETIALPLGSVFGFVPVFIYGAWLGLQIKTLPGFQ
jgi:hypothetical protein